mmetsp:Transcript_83940/g.145807  ORF Transcript_83940/g.145807 Transcript_83940/m.145807 type:complete len:258 (+) Transcript_83940:70-843(+)
MASGVAFLSLLVPITAVRPDGDGDGIYSSAMTATAAEPRVSSRTLESFEAIGVTPQGHLLGHANRSHGHIDKAAAVSVEKEEPGQKMEVQASALFQKKSSARAAKAGKDEEDIKAFLYAFGVSSIIMMGGAAGYYFYTEERKKKKNDKDQAIQNEAYDDLMEKIALPEMPDLGMGGKAKKEKKDKKGKKETKSKKDGDVEGAGGAAPAAAAEPAAQEAAAEEPAAGQVAAEGPADGEATGASAGAAAAGEAGEADAA